jgi:hypothetical protein
MNRHQLVISSTRQPVTTKKDAIRNQAKVFQPRLAFMRQRRVSCYQCRLSLNLDSNLWERLEKGKGLDKGIYRPKHGRLGRYIFKRPLTPGSTTDDGEVRALLSCNKFEAIRYIFVKNAA